MSDARRSLQLSPPLLDRAAVIRNFGRAAPTYDKSAVLAAILRRQMIGRLRLVAFSPDAILDLGCGPGRAAAALAARWPGARVLALDASAPMLRESGRHEAPSRIDRIRAEAESLPLADASVDLVFSNLMLPWCEDIEAVLGEVARVLRPRGLFTFTTYGPDTLMELRAAWRAADGAAHVHPFTGMHELGDGLVRAGFAEPVLDVSRYALTYPDVHALMRDLRATGSQNAASARPRGLTGRRRMQAMTAAYEQFRTDGVLPASHEVVFGQAWGALERGRRSGEFSFPASAIGRRGAPP